jgi:hypothetical protein
MNILDKIALNRLIKIITNFILAILKMVQPHVKNIDGVPFPVSTKPKFPWVRKKIDSVLKKK